MGRFTNSLARVRVAAPCRAEWDEMRGDERVRFCHLCSLNVYNLSAMTRREAERLVLSAEGRMCVRFYRRADGTMLTQPCPVGLRALKRHVSRVASAAFAAMFSFLVGVGIAPQKQQITPAAQTIAQPIAQPIPLASEKEFTTFEGQMGDPLGGTIVSSGMLASIIFVFGYPLMKLRARREAERSKELHIWRRS
ncbi:MAG: hypothetical protein QOF61_3273 [Acidobacteriota bacterium]|jgi:hypothetical protein|nr:hypothetical protein [Acidobacteriota bacterium]